jgi:hypothetical protein
MLGVSTALGWKGVQELLMCFFQYLYVSVLKAVINHVISEFTHYLRANFIVSLNRPLLKLPNIMQACVTPSQLMK